MIVPLVSSVNLSAFNSSNAEQLSTNMPPLIVSIFVSNFFNAAQLYTNVPPLTVANAGRDSSVNAAQF